MQQFVLQNKCKIYQYDISVLFHHNCMKNEAVKMTTTESSHHSTMTGASSKVFDYLQFILMHYEINRVNNVINYLWRCVIPV